MRDDFVSVDPSNRTLQDLAAPLVRRRKAALALFLAMLTLVATAAWVAPAEYVSEATFVVRRDRVDPVVTADPTAPSSQSEVTESELLSEAEILRSRDLLEQVVLAARLHDPALYGDAREESLARAQAIRKLDRALSITPIRRTTLIRVRYAADDPRTAHLVLEQLAERYLDKHLAVHRAAGTQEFFGEQVVRSREALADAQSRLTAFSEREQVVAPEQERTAVLQQLAAFETALQQARAEAADAERRLATVQTELQTTPNRQVTTVRTGANGALIGQLKARILEMELEREALQRKFTPEYPAVTQLEAQLQHARDALAASETAPILDETTDQNPTHQWLRTEESRIRAERAALGARVTAIGRSIQIYQERARRLDGQTVQQQNLARSVTAAEDAFLLYQRKQEEARISDALDSTRIANVGVVDPPTVPASESGAARALILWLGVITSLIVGVGGAYALDRLRPVIYSTADAQGAVSVPVLATMTASAK